jgi:hypothetical protein
MHVIRQARREIHGTLWRMSRVTAEASVVQESVRMFLDPVPWGKCGCVFLICGASANLVRIFELGKAVYEIWITMMVRGAHASQAQSSFADSRRPDVKG